MSLHELTRSYGFSDADLIQAATQQLRLMARDTVEFSEYGFNATKRNDFETALSAFSNFPTDVVLEGAKMIKTEAKNNARVALETSVRDIQFMAKLAFNNKPAYLKAFGDTALTKQSDNDLLLTGRNVQKSIIKYNQELSDSGLSADKNTAFEDALQAFQEAFNDMEDAIQERDISTHDRIEAANKLYNLYSIYAQLGQHIWSGKNEAKYNDYIIYGTQSSNAVENTDPQADI
jgi:hypothetical protein